MDGAVIGPRQRESFIILLLFGHADGEAILIYWKTQA